MQCRVEKVSIGFNEVSSLVVSRDRWCNGMWKSVRDEDTSAALTPLERQGKCRF